MDDLKSEHNLKVGMRVYHLYNKDCGGTIVRLSYRKYPHLSIAEVQWDHGDLGVHQINLLRPKN
jgi:hypothetical protein